jgi:hypothetical protein
VPQGEGTWSRLLWMMLRSTSAGPFRRRACGRPPCYSSNFLRREGVILRERAAGGGEWGSPAGTFEERECCCRNGSGVLRREKRVVSEGEDRDEQ